MTALCGPSKGSVCSILVNTSNVELLSLFQLRKMFETGDDEQVISALKMAIMYILNGESTRILLMTIIRFVLPSKNKIVKKLTLLYWEVVDKSDEDGKLYQELILVCNSLMRDLNHPNEYIRGATLRLLFRLKEPELVGPLIDAVKENLTQRHSYVRRNAVLALYSVYCSIPELVPDLEELVSAYLDSESEPACKRNGYLVMFGACPRLAEKKVGVMEEVLEMEEPMQLLMLRAIRRCMDEGAERTKRGEEMRIEGDSWSTEGEGKWKRHVVFDDAGFIRRVSGLRLSLIRVTFMCLSPSMKQSAVKYEAAMTMLRSSRAPTAVKAACKALLQLVDELSDNNVRVMVVECLTGVAKTSKKVLSELVLDVLRLLWAQPVKLELVRRVLNLVVELVMPQNWQQVLSLLKKEIVKSQRKGFEQAEPYRKLIIHALNELVVRYPAIVTSVVMELLDLLGDKDVAGEVGMLVMEVASRYEDKREEILENMYKHMDQITTGAPLQLVLWIVGEYETREKWMKRCIQMCGRWLLGSEQMGRILERLSVVVESGKVETLEGKEQAGGNKVLSDGTYLSGGSSSWCEKPISLNTFLSEKETEKYILLSGVLANINYYLASQLATTLTKLAIRMGNFEEEKGRFWGTLTICILCTYLKNGCNANTMREEVEGWVSRSIGPAIRKVFSRLSAGSVMEDAFEDQQRRWKEDEHREVKAWMRAKAEKLATPTGMQDVVFDISQLDVDSYNWISLCIYILLKGGEKEKSTFLNPETSIDASEYYKKNKLDPLSERVTPVHQFLQFSFLRPVGVSAISTDSNMEPEGLASSDVQSVDVLDDFSFPVPCVGRGSSKSSRVSWFDSAQLLHLHQRCSASPTTSWCQLTGVNDPVYVEAMFILHQFDMAFDLVLINQTDDTLENLTIELSAIGNLRLQENTHQYTLPPHETLTVNYQVHTLGIEVGTIFGCIAYTVADQILSEQLVFLSVITLDMIDYLQPKACSLKNFRRMWATFEWDAKFPIRCSCYTFQELLETITSSTHLQCVTPFDSEFAQFCGFLATNLYAKSKFGEDALANLSVQAVSSCSSRPVLDGFIRIRARSRGVVDSLRHKLSQTLKIEL